MLRQILLFVHVLLMFLYLLAHGSSVAVAFRVRRETNAERVRALLDVSRSTVKVANTLLMTGLAFGIALGFLGHWWRAGWIWTSIVVLVLIFITMGRAVGPHFRRVRNAVGLVLVDDAWAHTGQESSPDELAHVLESGKPALITGVTMGGWAVILWLMLFKPF